MICFCINDNKFENIFKRLPIKFRNTDSNLSNTHCQDILYRNTYEACADGQK